MQSTLCLTHLRDASESCTAQELLCRQKTMIAHMKVSAMQHHLLQEGSQACSHRQINATIRATRRLHAFCSMGRLIILKSDIGYVKCVQTDTVKI